MIERTDPSNIETLARKWTRLGAMFGVQPAGDTPDPEQLLLESARAAADNPLLFVMAVSWLVPYGELVRVCRLARLIHDELEASARPTMGLLLETADSASGDRRFEPAIRECGSAIDEGPLFDVYRNSTALTELARGRASALSRKWGRWVEDFDLKADAIRPREWVLRQNPELSTRHDTAASEKQRIASDLPARLDD